MIRNVRLSIALSVAEYAALDWYAVRCSLPTSTVARTMLLEALLPRLQKGTLEGNVYHVAMKQRGQLTVEEERA